MVDRDRLIDNFLKLVNIDSPSGKERAVAGFIREQLGALGLETIEDRAGEKIRGDSGNLIAKIPANGGSGPNLLLAAHMDTVVSNAGLKTVEVNGIIKTDGKTILGADDKAGVAIILEAVKVLLEEKAKHSDITLVFTAAEETGLFGAKYLDEGVLKEAGEKQSLGFVLDSGGPVGTVIVTAPSEEDFTIEIKGKKAHAGVNPEDGVNAIMAAGKLLARLPGGRLDEESSANIGIIQGGEATNIVPDMVILEGEVRSRNPEKIRDYLEKLSRELVDVASGTGVRYRLEARPMYDAFNIGEDAPVIRAVKRAAEKTGFKFNPRPRGGGSDANVFNARGIPTVNLGIGMVNDHTNEEYIAIDDMLNGATLLLEIMRNS